MDKEQKPSIYIGKHPWIINFTGVDRMTNEVKENLKPKDAPNPSRLDGFAEALAYQRCTD